MSLLLEAAQPARAGGRHRRAERPAAKDKLHRIYEQATRDPYSFLFARYLKPKNEMFYLRFEERFALEKEADGGGAQLIVRGQPQEGSRLGQRL